ncbi:hypothetical protein [Flavobacterium sp.]|uniref:hypothetical protein n=1 Tax=Flavobacterium sp. TaxID=239 RepID=UPI0035295CE5
MNNLNKNIRLLPVLVIILTISGFLLLTYQTFNLINRKITLLNEIKELENDKKKIINDLKFKNTIISIQETIITQSSDSTIVKKD